MNKIGLGQTIATLHAERSWRYHWDARKRATDPEFVRWMEQNVLD